MTTRPILFSGPMVRALLAGRKTQTRRIVRGVPPPPELTNIEHAARHPFPYLDAYCGGTCTPENPRGMTEWWCWWTRDDRPCEQFKIGYAPGDLLWVRETLRYNWGHGAWFRDADDTRLLPGETLDTPRPDRWPMGVCPNLYMPRTLSRLTLEVTGVKIERLQEISEADAKAEGIEFAVRPFGDWKLIPGHWDLSENAVATGEQGEPPPKIKYAHLWNTIHDKPGTRWADNPWVVAVTFRVNSANVDTYLAQRATEPAA